VRRASWLSDGACLSPVTGAPRLSGGFVLVGTMNMSIDAMASA
jgi:hypothetical protein